MSFHAQWDVVAASAIIGEQLGREAPLLPILQELQSAFGHIPEPAVPMMVTAVQITLSNGPSRWQEEYEEFSRESRRIASLEAAE